MFELTGGLKKVGSDRTRTDPKKLFLSKKMFFLYLLKKHSHIFHKLKNVFMLPTIVIKTLYIPIIAERFSIFLNNFSTLNFLYRLQPYSYFFFFGKILVFFKSLFYCFLIDNVFIFF